MTKENGFDLGTAVGRARGSDENSHGAGRRCGLRQPWRLGVQYAIKDKKWSMRPWIVNGKA